MTELQMNLQLMKDRCNLCNLKVILMQWNLSLVDLLLISEVMTNKWQTASSWQTGKKSFHCAQCAVARGADVPERGWCWELWSLSSRLLPGTAGQNPNRCHTFSQPHTNAAGKEFLIWWCNAGLSERILNLRATYERWPSALRQTLFMVTQCDMTKRTQSQGWLHQQWVCETNTAYRLSVSS